MKIRSEKNVAPAVVVEPVVTANYLALYSNCTTITSKNGNEFVDLNANLDFMNAIIDDESLKWTDTRTEYEGLGVSHGQKARLGNGLLADFSILNGNERFYCYKTANHGKLDAFRKMVENRANQEVYGD